MRDNRYNIVGVLGEGGMGTVWLAEDLRLQGKRWAIKEMRAGMPGFSGEAATLARLSHPGLPQVADWFESEDGERRFLVMEYIEGETLEQRFVRCGRKVDAATAVHWAVQLCDVLGYLHGIKPHPVVHRDLKPSNIMVTARDRVVLIDFGISRLDRGGGKDTVQMGTIAFAAPELLEHGKTDPRSDLYSLGAILFYLLSGGRYPTASMLSVTDQLAGVPYPLRRIVEKLLDSSPERRYADADSVKADLTVCLAGPFPSGDRIHSVHARKRILALLSLYPGAGSTMIGLAAAALFDRFGIANAHLEHPESEPVLDGWLDPAVTEGGFGKTVWLTAGRLEQRYGKWEETVQLQALYETEAQVVVADLSHQWEGDTASRLLALADEIAVVAGPRRMPLISRRVRERIRMISLWLESGRPVTLIRNGVGRRNGHVDPDLDELPFHGIVRLPCCPAMADWEWSGNPQGALLLSDMRPWLAELEGWLLDLCKQWAIPALHGKGRNRFYLPGSGKWKKRIDNIFP